MSSRVAGGHTLPPDPVYLDFGKSDGDTKQLPNNTKEVVGADGQVNYMKPLELDDSSNIHWRSQVAMKIAERLGRPSGKNYVLRSWPEGYHMYCHLKGKQSAPRQDLYLLGSVHAKRFRSVPEFVPHALWLMTDPTLDRRNCECKYCAKVPQRVISENLGYKHRTDPRLEPRAGPRRASRGPRPRAAFPALRTGRVMLQERYADVQAMYADTNAEMRRWFRVGELVWCALDPPIRGADAAANITFWPGLVDECSFKTETLPRPKSPSIHSADGDFEMEDGTESVAHVGRGIGSSNGAGSSVAIPYAITPHTGNSKPMTERPLPWTVRQKNVYKVKLLAVNHDYIAVETQVLPYHSYKPSYDLIQALQDVPIERITHKPDEIAAFNPCPPELLNAEPSADDRRFAESTASYTLALEIAAGVEVCWTPTDEWVFKMVVPSGPSDAGETSARALQASVVNQTRYQGLWLGAERIWTDDLVRLKAARGQIAPKDQEFMKAQGAPGRGVFMQLEALFVVDVPDASGAGVHAECRGSGMLYELADEDWEEPQSRVSTSDTENGVARECRARRLDSGRSVDSTAPAKIGDDTRNTHTAASASTPPRERNKEAAATMTTARLDADAPNMQLSRSSKMSAVPLPPAPRGFRFRPILPEGHEVVVSLALVSGRYYPRLLAHPLPAPDRAELAGRRRERADEEALSTDRLFALEGILPGFVSASEATRWKPGRATMVRDAAAERSAVLARVWDCAAAATEPSQSQHEDVGMQDLESPAIGASTPTDLQEVPPAPSVTAAT
ncbi:hypothetical protein EDB89DRAFT_2193152 [Lactarius sanguifluus]|nr:hypothetical protein EDB89DRAFT_2193152 [Lactarius sanguifluus]